MFIIAAVRMYLLYSNRLQLLQWTLHHYEVGICKLFRNSSILIMRWPYSIAYLFTYYRI